MIPLDLFGAYVCLVIIGSAAIASAISIVFDLWMEARP